MSLLFRAERLLVIAPHADDETIGAGGLIAHLHAQGACVYVIIVTVADFAYYPQRAVPDSAAAWVRIPGQARLAELAAALQVLAVDDYEVLYTAPEYHMRLDQVPQVELVRRLEREARLALDRVAPDVLVLPAPSYNQDHTAVWQAGLAATRLHPAAGKATVPVVLTCDMPHLCWGPQPFLPRCYVDISAELPTKLRALRCYASQLRPPLDHTSVEAVEALARLRGVEAGTAAAEAFAVHRMLL